MLLAEILILVLIVPPLLLVAFQIQRAALRWLRGYAHADALEPPLIPTRRSRRGEIGPEAKLCPGCGNQIAHDARNCPHCALRFDPAPLHGPADRTLM